jgi:hypothetical protein
MEEIIEIAGGGTRSKRGRVTEVLVMHRLCVGANTSFRLSVILEVVRSLSQRATRLARCKRS